MSTENLDAMAASIKIEREKEKAQHAASIEARPLSEVILDDLTPFHVTEKRVKTERYNKAMINATPEEKKILTEEYNKYLEQYKQDWETEKTIAPITIVHPKVIDDIPKPQTQEVKSFAIDAVKIIGIESEALEKEWQAKNGPAQMTLFDFDVRPSPAKEMSARLAKPYKKVMDTTVSNFQERLQRLCKNRQGTKQVLLGAAHTLLDTMAINEKKAFNEKIIALGCSRNTAQGKASLEDILVKLVNETASLMPLSQERAAASIQGKRNEAQLVHDKRKKNMEAYYER